MDPPPPYHDRTTESKTHQLSEPSTADSMTVDALLSSRETGESLSLIRNHHNDRKVWLCPHRGIDFDQVRELFASVPVSKSLTSITCNSMCSRIVCQTNLRQQIRIYREERGDLSHELLSTVKLFWAPSSLHPQERHTGIFSLGRIATALHGLDFPICTHLRLNQTFILSKFNPECLYTRSHGVDSPCTCYKSQLSGKNLPTRRTTFPRICKNVGRCPECDRQGLSTTFVLRVKEYTCEGGQEEVSLSVCFLRNLGRLRTADEAAWLNSTVKSHELEYMRSIWRGWEKHIWRLRDLWFEPLFPLRDPTTSSSPQLIPDKITAAPVSSTKTAGSVNTIAFRLKEHVRKNALRCLQSLTDSLSARPS